MAVGGLHLQRRVQVGGALVIARAKGPPDVPAAIAEGNQRTFVCGAGFAFAGAIAALILLPKRTDHTDKEAHTMTVKLHRCPATFAKSSAHPCWKVQKALDDAGIDYVVVKQPFRKSKRTDLEQRSGQRLVPAIQFEDGTILREESDELAARISAGRLMALPVAPGAAKHDMDTDQRAGRCPSATDGS